MSTIRAVARRFTSWNFAPSRSLVAASQYSGSRFYSSFNDDYQKSVVRALYCNHPNCDNWDNSNGLSDPINMIDHWNHVHQYKGVNFCAICGNCIENDKLPCKSFPPYEECPRKTPKHVVEFVKKSAAERVEKNAAEMVEENAAKRNRRRRPQAKFTTKDSKKED